VYNLTLVLLKDRYSPTLRVLSQFVTVDSTTVHRSFKCRSSSKEQAVFSSNVQTILFTSNTTVAHINTRGRMKLLKQSTSHYYVTIDSNVYILMYFIYDLNIKLGGNQS